MIQQTENDKIKWERNYQYYTKENVSQQEFGGTQRNVCD